MQNRILIVLGMHRSGTSLISNWLFHCGLQLGETMLGPGLGNDEGHYEDDEFYKLHLEILRDNNLHDSGLLVDPEIKLSDYHKAKIKAVISVKNKKFEEWAWKDPRTCLFLDFYGQAVPGAVYLVALRDFQSVVVSLLKRSFALLDIKYDTEKNSLSRLNWYKVKRKRQQQKFYHQHAEHFLKVWCCYNRLILNFIQTLPADRFVVLNYKSLINTDDQLAAFLENNWGFELNPVKFSTIYKEGLLSKPFDVEQYIDDKELITSAKKLTAQLEAYAFHSSLVLT
jgi:hypothetical protein